MSVRDDRAAKAKWNGNEKKIRNAKSAGEKNGAGKKTLTRLFLNNILLLAVFAAAGFLLLFLVHLIPVDRMQQHVRESLPMIEAEFERSSLIDEYPASFVGGFTDCLMLENAVYKNPDHSTLEQTLLMYRGESGEGEGWATGYSLTDFLYGEEQTREESYARYWHGYLVVLKPLLYLTNFNTIRLLQASLQMLLAGAVAIAFSKRGKPHLGEAFILSLPFLYFFSLYASLSLSVCFYIMAGALLIQAKYDDVLRDRNLYAEFFLVVGMTTSYFDFLTYPLVTLGFPLCVWLYAAGGISGDRRKDRLLGMLVNTVEWFAGYGGMWAIKWVIADLLTGSGTIRDGIATLFERTDAVESVSRLSGYIGVVKENAGFFANWGFYLILLGIVVWLVMTVGKDHSENRCVKSAVMNTVPFLIVALYPFIWFFFTQNHSYEHSIFTCKILSVTVFALICGADFSRSDGGLYE